MPEPWDETLTLIASAPVPVYVSVGVEQQALPLAARFTRAYTFLTATLDLALDVRLALLSQADWLRFAAVPYYGAALYDYPQRTVIAGPELTSFWQPALALVRSHAPRAYADLERVYPPASRLVDISPHIELWMLHDLGHACHLQHGYWFPRKWLMELFANLCLVTFIGANEPKLLPVADTFLRALHTLPASLFPHRTLDDFEALYTALPLENYLWFSGHFMAQARALYDQFGIAALQRIWQWFVVANVREISDEALAESLLRDEPELAPLLLRQP